jgi:outer membrane receptor protein involved in Fe transport
MTKLNDMITKDYTTRKYIQSTDTDFIGSEVEYTYLANNNFEFNIFASYIQAEDEEGNDLPDIANILATTSLIYNTKLGIYFGSLLKYVSSSKRESNDARDDMPHSVIFDETISYNFKNFSASFVVKDLFDQGTYYALPPKNHNTDYNDGGRSFLIKADMEF